jgi:3-hydroxyisobutyrate dehydrogenase-like beta-hydroxyacid dehydrogenase
MTPRIGFIGLGAMGKPMAVNLVKKRFPLTVYDLRPEPMEQLAALGAQKAASSKEVADKSDVVITMLVSSPDVEAAVLGPGGVLEGLRPGSVLIDMSSIAPAVTRKVGAKVREKEADILDAPVARGVKAAAAGTLAVFVGGSRQTFERCRHILQAMATDIDYVGGLGCGATVKLVNQLILSATVAATAEGLVLGVKGGVDPDTLVEVLGKGSANSFALQNHFKKFALKGDFGESVFPVPYIQKDIGLAMETGKELGVPLLMASIANQMYEMARATGRSKNYFPVVIQVLEDLAGVEVRGRKE